MEKFYMIVLGIAIVVLIAILIFVGIMMQYQNAGDSWPPSSNTCPDYWKVDGSNCIVPHTGTSGTFAISGTNVGNMAIPSASLLASNANGFGGSNTNGGSQSVNALIPNDAYWTTAKSNTSKVPGLDTKCYLGAWARNNKIEWNGYSNYNKCSADIPKTV
jgi:hypothetical protein